jgi:hypothetical protein
MNDEMAIDTIFVNDEIKLTLSIDEAVTLAKVARNKIVIAGKEFLLTGTNGKRTV